MALTLATELADYASGIGTQGATLKIDADNKRVGVGTTNPQGPEGTLQVGTGITFFGNTGIISAIGGKFSGDFTVGGTLTYEDVQNVNSSRKHRFRCIFIDNCKIICLYFYSSRVACIFN